MIAISAESDNMAKVCFSGPWAIWCTTIRRTTAASNTPGNTVGSNFPDAPLVSNIETAEQGYTSTSLIQFGSAPGGNWRLERMGQGGRDASATSNFLTMNRGTVRRQGVEPDAPAVCGRLPAAHRPPLAAHRPASPCRLPPPPAARRPPPG